MTFLRNKTLQSLALLIAGGGIGFISFQSLDPSSGCLQPSLAQLNEQAWEELCAFVREVENSNLSTAEQSDLIQSARNMLSLCNYTKPPTQPTNDACSTECSLLATISTDGDSLVPLNTARAAIQLFGRFNGTVNNMLNAKLPAFRHAFWRKAPHSWVIPVENLEAIVNDSFRVGFNSPYQRADGARVYMGTVRGGVHLFMVPVRKDSPFEDAEGNRNYVDMFPRNADGKMMVYDFITPCPKLCGARDSINNRLHREFLGGQRNPWTQNICIDSCRTCWDTIVPDLQLPSEPLTLLQ